VVKTSSPQLHTAVDLNHCTWGILFSEDPYWTSLIQQPQNQKLNSESYPKLSM